MADVNIDVLHINTAPAENSMKNLKQQLKDTKEQMMELRMRGAETSEEYKKLAQRAGELAKAMQRANEDIREASTTFSNTVSYVSGSLAGVSGAVQAATGALSLMGVEMGSDTKLMKTLVAAMSVTSGLTAIQASVEAFKKLTTNIKRSTLAQQGLNAAMKANPAMFAIAAIAALGAALAAFTIKAKKAAKEAKESMEDAAKKAEEAWKERLENIKGIMAEMANTTSKGLDYWNLDEFNRNKDAYIQSLEDAGTSLGAEMNRIQRQQREFRKNMADPNWIKTHEAQYRQFIQNQKNLQYLFAEDEGVITREIQEAWGNATKKLIEYEGNLAAARQQAADKRAAQAKSDKEKADAELKAEQDKVKGILDSLKSQEEQEIQALTEKYNVEKALLEKNSIDTKALTEKFEKERLEIRKKYLDEETQAIREEAQDNYDEERLRAETDYYQKKLQLVVKNEKDINKKLAELELAQIDREKELLKQKLDDNLITNEEYQNQLTQLELEQAETRKQIAEDEAEQKKKIQESYMNAMQKITSSLASVLGSLADTVSEDTEAYKNLKAAQAIISTLSAAVAAFAGITESTGGWGIAAAIAEAAAVVATGMAEVRKIYAVDTSGGKNSTSTTSINSSAVTTLGQNYNNTRILDNGGGVYDLSRLENQGATKVYVTTHDITSTARKVEVSTRRNKF